MESVQEASEAGSTCRSGRRARGPRRCRMRSQVGRALERERLEHEGAKVSEDAKHEERERREEPEGRTRAKHRLRRAHIGTLNEKPLHAALKDWYGRPGDQFEVRVDGFFIDIVRPRSGQEDLLIEIQTKNLFAMKRKLTRLVETHPVRLVHPIGQEKWIVRQGEDGEVIGRRRSPKRGRVGEHLRRARQLPAVARAPELHARGPAGSRGRGAGPRRDGQLAAAGLGHERAAAVGSGQLARLRAAGRSPCARAAVPCPIRSRPCSSRTHLDRPAWLARRMTYCLREMGMLAPAGKRGRSNLFTRTFRGESDEQTEASEPDSAGVGVARGCLRRAVARATRNAGRRGRLVGQGHPGARYDVGGGGAEEPPAHPGGQAHRRATRTSTAGSTRSTIRWSSASAALPLARSCSNSKRRIAGWWSTLPKLPDARVRNRDAVPPSHPLGHLQPLSAPREGDP